MKAAMPLSPSCGRLVTAAAIAMIALDPTTEPSIAQQIAQAEAQPAQSFYAGRTIKLIVGLPPGGGADAYARLVQRHLGRHIAGAPAILIQNMPGAGSLRSVMALNAAPGDGTVMAHFSSALLSEAITAPERTRLDFRNFAWLGNVSEDVRVCYLRAASGIHDWPDMLTRNEVVFGATAQGNAGNVDTAMLRHLFGVKLKQVSGYAGSAEKRLAVEKGEIDGDCGGWTSVPDDWLRDRKINVMIRLSPTLVPGMDPNVPFGGDLVRDAGERKIYDFLTAPERLGRLFTVAGAVPADRVAVLRAGFDAMVVDPDFLADAAQLRLLVTPMAAAEVARRVGDLYATPADVLGRAKAIAAE
jgi:tripartite-type tricarboxylate transporter receptor subunit TctC